MDQVQTPELLLDNGRRWCLRGKYQRNWCGRPHSLKRNDVVATQFAYCFPKLQEFLRISMLSIVPRATKGLHEIQWNNRMLDRTVPVSTQPIRLQNTQRAAFTLDVARRALGNQGQRGGATALGIVLVVDFIDPEL